MEKATLGIGCFWCAEAVFKLLPGVGLVTLGYAGYVEVVSIEYDNKKTSFEDLLKIFWEIHDPTQKDRQGPDVGPEYQATIFYHTPEQKKAAEDSKKEIEKRYKNPVETRILPSKDFTPAPEYHQDYYAKNPDSPYSQAVITPKVQKVWRITGKKS